MAAPPDGPPEDGEPLDEQTVLLDLLFSHRLGWVRDFLRARKLPKSGNQDVLRTRVESLLDDGTLSFTELVALLDTVEGWGNQHVYLYRAKDGLLASLSDEHELKLRLKKRGCLDLFNQAVPLSLPAIPTLSTIQWIPDRLRFVWIETRHWRARVPDQDLREGPIEFDAYRPMTGRGLVSFSCDLTSGHAELLIERLPSGENYAAEKSRYANLLSAFLDIGQLDPVAITRVIKKFDEDKTIRKRSCQFATAYGSGCTYTSRSAKEDVYNDPSIKKARTAMGTQMAGRLGNFYQPTADGGEIHIKLYGKDQRIGIFGELSEMEVRDVLARIRRHCR